MRAECAKACAKAHADQHLDLQDGWQEGEYMRGEWLSREDFRYPHRSVWEILRQYSDVKVGDWVHSSIDLKAIHLVEKISEEDNLIFNYQTDLRLLDRDEWVLDDWCKTFQSSETTN